MKNLYITLIISLLVINMQAQTFDFSLSYIGVNGSTNNYQVALMATPSSSVTNGVTADMGAGLYLPTGLTIGNFVTGNSGLPASEWSVQVLGASNANGDPYFLSRAESGSSSIIFDGAGPFELVLFDVISNPNPNTGEIKLVENSDPVFNELLFISNYININLGSGSNDAYLQNDPAASSIDFSTLGLDGSLANYNISIYPNPTSNVVSIESQIQMDSVELFDLLGKRVLITDKMEQIKVNHLPAGVYILKAHSEKGSITKKLIIE